MPPIADSTNEMPPARGGSSSRYGEPDLDALGLGEPRALDEVHHRGRHAAEPLAGAPRRLEILAAQLRMAREELGRVAAHERKVERPPGEPEQRHPDQLPLQEELQERYAAVEDRLQHQDVDPGAVIRHDQVPLPRLEPLEPGDDHRHRAHQPEDPAVAGDPALGEPRQRPAASTAAMRRQARAASTPRPASAG